MNAKADVGNNKHSRVFLTGNYVEEGVDALGEDLLLFEEKIGAEVGPEGMLDAACIWEERGLETGNPHYHAILIFKRQYRSRLSQIADLVCKKAGLRVWPHIEPLRDLAAAMQYRDKPSKAEAWSKWGEGLPYFFAGIHSGFYRRDSLRVFELILGRLWPELPLTRSWYSSIPIVLHDADKSRWTISVSGGLDSTVKMRPNAYGYTEAQALEKLAWLRHMLEKKPLETTSFIRQAISSGGMVMKGSIVS